MHAAAERCEYLADLCRRSNLRVKGYASSESGCPFSDPRENIAVCSYEKGNSALNRLVAKGMAADLCCVVIDEFHMLVDPGRGAALEVRDHILATTLSGRAEILHELALQCVLRPYTWYVVASMLQPNVG